MFFNNLIDAAKQKAASIKWENARTRFDVRIGIRIRIHIRFRTGRTDRPVMGSNFPSSTR